MNTTISLYRVTLVASALLGVLATTAPALATETTADGNLRIRIATSGLDLTSGKVLADLEARVRRAAKTVCYVDSTHDLGLIVAQKQCVDKAVTNGNRQIALLRTARMAARSNGVKTASINK